MDGTAGTAGGHTRIPAIDIARTVALVAMAVFHFTYDLELFGHIPPGTSVTGFWAIFARLIAGSFLFLAGVSLWLAHGKALRPASFLRRLAIVAGSALLITIVTRFALPHRFIYFGILHSIATASVIGLAFLRLSAALTLGAALAVFAVSRFPGSEAFDAPWLWWLGLSANERPSIDFVPVFPWLAPCLAGIALAKLADRAGIWDRLRVDAPPGTLLGRLSWPGRHSLPVYLVHQPVLVALVWAATQVLR